MATTLEAMFREHWPLVVGYLTRRTGSASTAEDLAGETFYRATRAFLGWRGGSPAAWLLTIARNVLTDHARKRRDVLALYEATLPAIQPNTTSSEVRDLLSRLPSSQRRVLELVYLDGFTHSEVAVIQGSTTAAVKTAVWRARDAFRNLYLEGQQDD